MQVIIDKRPDVAINGDREDPVDQNLFNALIWRCREVNNQVRVVQDQLAESKGFQYRENDLQNGIHRLEGMVDKLRDLNE
eukprot:11287228-Heterocapsa_arctica.AAC.1